MPCSSHSARTPSKYPAGGVNEPPAFCTGSMITIATVSGPACTIVASSSSRRNARELLLGLLGRAVVAVRVRHVEHVRHERLERRAQLGAAGERERAHGGAVVGHAAGDRLPAPLAAGAVVLAGELPGRLGGLRPAGHEERAVEVARSELGQLRGQLDRARVGEGPVDRERQLAHLRGGRLAHLGAVAVADVHAEQPGERVEVALAVRVLEVAAVAAARSPGARAGSAYPPICVKWSQRWSSAVRWRPSDAMRGAIYRATDYIVQSARPSELVHSSSLVDGAPGRLC